MLRKLCAALIAVAVTVWGQAPYPQTYQQPQSYPPQPYPQTQAYPPQGYPQYGPQYQQPDAAADRQHGAARLSIVQGDVNVLRGDTGQLVAAVVNAPLMAQDHLQTSAGSRAEVQFDAGDIVRLAPDTDLGFAQVEDQRFLLQLGAGTVIYRVLRRSNTQLEIDTPLLGVRAQAEGDYRVSVLPDGTVQVSVRSGQAQLLTSNRNEDLGPGRTVLVRGNPQNPEFQSSYEPAPDQFDDWSANRDRELMQSQSYRYVSQDIAGAQDLDQYGNWVPSQYGQVWQPQAPPPDWSPYSDGEWVSEPYYGYTWVDAAPWGWAPYHYGRWFWNGGRGWCWWPGPVAALSVWNPAVVGFFGWGGFGFGLFGGIGWVALAPFEVFHSWWGRGAGPAYGGFRNFDVTRMYRNAAFRGGAVTAPYNGFAGPHSRFMVATRAQLTNATVFHGSLPVAATRTSFQYSNRQAFSNPGLATARSRQFFQSRQFGTRGFTPAPAGTPYINRGNSYAAPSRAPSQTSPSSSGWMRFGDPRTPPGVSRSFTGGASEPSGWHSFGQPSPGPSYSNGYQRSYRTPAPRQEFSAPRYSAPRQSAPRESSPHYSAPSSRGSSGGGSHRNGGGGGHGGRR